MRQGFSLLEVMIALVIASLALSWFLYFLSEVHYTQGKARERLKIVDHSYGKALWVASQLQEKKTPEEEDGLEVKSLSEDPSQGPFAVVLKEKGVTWELYLTPERPEAGHSSIQEKAKKLRDIFSGKTIKRPEIGPNLLGR